MVVLTEIFMTQNSLSLNCLSFKFALEPKWRRIVVLLCLSVYVCPFRFAKAMVRVLLMRWRRLRLGELGLGATFRVGRHPR